MISLCEKAVAASARADPYVGKAEAVFKQMEDKGLLAGGEPIPFN